MKLSVIVPVYNTCKYLKKCLDSIINQTYKDIEIIIVNDGSKDNSEDIIKEYLNKYKDKIVYIKQKNNGQGSARNNGLKHAKGEYIGFVDSDDFIEKDMYEKMIKIAEKNNSDIVICAINDYYEKNNLSCSTYLSLKQNVEVKEAIMNSIPSVVNKIYKRELIVNNKIFFNEKIWYEDFPYSIQLVMESKIINYINEPLYNYYHRVKSTMHNENISKNLDVLSAFELLLDYAHKNKLYEKYYKEINYLLLKEVYIAAINRIIRTNNKRKDKKKNINIIKKYCKKHEIKNEYFKLLPKSYKISYYLIKLRLYFMINIIFKLKEKK